MDKIRFSEGEVIFREGDFGKAMYEIYSGKVRVVSGYDTEDMMDLTELKRGAIFGEMAIIDIYPRSTTAIAKTDVCLIEVPDSKLSEYFNEKPGYHEEPLRKNQSPYKGLHGGLRDYQRSC
jgi:CRP-like cAMP-binding protein